MSDDHALTIVATGQARFDTVADGDGEMTIARSRTEEVTAEIELDADRLYGSDVASTHRSGATIPASDVADAVCDELDATPVDPLGWDVSVRGSLDDWQKVCLKAAKQRRSFESSRIDTTLDVLLSLHERHAETDRPIYAALNIDETYEGGRRGELLEVLSDDGPDTEGDAATEEVAGDD